MTTAKSVSTPKFKRGTHPKSLANLKPPWPPGYKPPGGGGETVSHALKDILREGKTEKCNARLIAEKMVERSLILTGKSDASILNQVLDRTEGKVPGDTPPQVNLNVVFVIGKGYKDLPRLIEGNNDHSD